MENYNEYDLDPKQFSFLKIFQDNWLEIKDGFTSFTHSATEQELKFTGLVNYCMIFSSQ